ncbi:hypothetical protein C8J57DRAFT_975062, partial [Mycena rebaudengoi]
GSGVWYGEGNHRNKSLRLPENFDQTISSAEIVAALYAVQTTPLQMVLRMEFEHRTVVEAVNKINTLEDSGWIGCNDVGPLRALAASLRAREAETTLKAVDEPTVGTVVARQLARDGALKVNPDAISLHADPDQMLRGAKLRSLTQSLAYKGI